VATNGNVVYTGTNVLTFTNTNGIEGVKFNKIGIENGIFLYDQATVSFDGEAYFNTISFQTTNDASGTRAMAAFRALCSSRGIEAPCTGPVMPCRGPSESDEPGV
jgi:hypothetical protein